ncbi:hypothetical protein Tco_1266041 [Tanacetum coccineum]
MPAAAMKHMASNFAKLDNPVPEDSENATVEQIMKKAKWYNDEYVCRGLILNVMEQYNELLDILGRFTQHKMNMDEAVQDSDKPKGNNIAGLSVVNTVKHNNSTKYNDNKEVILPSGCIAPPMFKFVMNEIPEFFNESYALYDRVMYPLTAQQERKAQKDYGIIRGRSSTSSSFAFRQPYSSYPNNDDDDDDDDANDEGTSRASTPTLPTFWSIL